ncbi:anhydro-N-acetylmuramic acid kinase [Amycolatopsis antarctica]|uniref:Anhydro-N-acetylmuramic acid kinase n=1 Tax=Amycolatopsis antarctica TaxID=1854586 RepID=A0A263D975_9PSEU|nr:anhydro-N-acetylmuramic acid kinase [Amycolatopsis antarctica]OZM74097.1 anhydro-N-acetylmuramic acid kinase [Amycolatopsis antarctica]
MVGLLSGTSIDGIDVAAAELHAADGELTLTPLGELEIPYPDGLRSDLIDALPPQPSSAERLTMLDTRAGQAFGDAAREGVEHLAGGRADLVASLGQTVFHWVEDGTALGTLQLGSPAWIAERTGLPVVADLRSRDVAAGGHGAPLASTLDALWLRGLAESTSAPAAALNIGGIANITVVGPDGGVLAYDTGPGNALLDLAATEVTGGAKRSDEGGELAAIGIVQEELLNRLLADPYYAAAPPKSTGKEHFHTAYLAEARRATADVGGADLLATLTELTAATIATECARHSVRTLVASGGGVENPALMRALAARLGDVDLRTSDDLGLPRAAKEAYLTALLGWLTWHGVPGNVPSATGARGPRVLGSLTPGAAGLSMPTPYTEPITRLRVAAAPRKR